MHGARIALVPTTHVTQLRFASLAVAALITTAGASTSDAQAAARERGPLNQYGNPMKIPPRPTKAAIDEADLRSRLYIFADDSMLGRAVNHVGNKKGTDYIAAELRRLGLEPAGDNGTFFQIVPYASRYYSPDSWLGVEGRRYRWGVDVVPAGGTLANLELNDAQVIYGGVAGDTSRQMAPGLAIGRVVVLSAADAAGAPQPAAGRGGAGGRGGGGGGGRGGPGGGGAGRFAGALAVLTLGLDAVPAPQRTAMSGPPQRATLQNPAPAPRPGQALGAVPAPPALLITAAMGEDLLGGPVSAATPGSAGRRVSGTLTVATRPSDNPEYARNVVAILRGSDPVLQNEYVAIGAHNDHTGIAATPVDHDSLRAILTATYQAQMADGRTVQGLSPELRQRAIDGINWAEMRRRAGPPRPDSIRNGADDDGSGSMAVLEIAEALAHAAVKPKRSILFVWHTGEEAGLAGSAYFTNNPTVPRESIVTQINVDMIGRGRADDLPGGGPDYLAVIGANRLSSDLGRMVTEANGRQTRPLKLDYQFDEPSEWSGYNNLYGRSDHFNYARYNIPIAFFFTGLHRDYHQVTDEPQYIDYPHYTRITRYLHDLTRDIGNAAQRPRLDRPPM